MFRPEVIHKIYQGPKWKQDQLMTLLIAGHETSALVLTWAVHLLSLYPEYQERARASDVVLGQVIEETLRLYPPVWCLGREALDDVQLGPYKISKGDTVILSLFSVHRCARIWERPNDFWPERFDQKQKKHSGQFFPFSSGARFCVGESFARLEITLVLKELLKRYEWIGDLETSIGVDAKITLRPDKEIRVIFKKRHS